MKKAAITLLCVLALSACDATKEPAATSGEAVADQLEGAANQSGPAAKKILEDAAAEAREHQILAPVDEPGSFAQEAMQKAGNAQATAPATQASPSAK